MPVKKITKGLLDIITPAQKKYMDFLYKDKNSVLGGDLTFDIGKYDLDDFESGLTDAEYNSLVNSDWFSSVQVPLSKTDADKVINKVNTSILYHGSPDPDISQLERRSNGGLFTAFEKNDAASYAGDGRIYEQSLDIKNPFFVKSSDVTHDMENTGLLSELAAKGYDSIVPLDYGDIVVLTDKPIKSLASGVLPTATTGLMGLGALGASDDSEAGAVTKTLGSIIKSAQDAGVKLDVFEGKKGLELSKIVVPEKSKGVGSSIMNDLSDYADQTNQTISLTPSTDFGGTSKKRLADFYKRFGFVQNKGKNKDYSIFNSMYRSPSITSSTLPVAATGLMGVSSARAAEIANTDMRDVGSIQAANHPSLQKLAGLLGGIDTPLGKPFENIPNSLLAMAYGDEADLERSFLSALDVAP